MPWGLTRFHHSGQSHFVTLCCYHRPIRLLRCAQSLCRNSSRASIIFNRIRCREFHALWWADGPWPLRAGSGCLPRTQADESSSQPWSACGAVSGFRFTGTWSCRSMWARFAHCFGASALFRSKKVAEQKRYQRQDGLCDHEIERKIQGIAEVIGRRFVKIQDCFVILGFDRGCQGWRQ